MTIYKDMPEVELEDEYDVIVTADLGLVTANPDLLNDAILRQIDDAVFTLHDRVNGRKLGTLILLLDDEDELEY
jgi:hypothetical protein